MAFAFAPRTRYCDARGPAPQSIQSLIAEDALSDLGRVLETSSTAKSITLSAIGTLLTSS